MHDQCPGLVRRQIGRPADDEFLGSRVEISLTERRGIDLIEELPELCDADLDDLAVLRQSVPSGRPSLRHLSSLEDGTQSMPQVHDSIAGAAGAPGILRPCRIERARVVFKGGAEMTSRSARIVMTFTGD